MPKTGKEVWRFNTIPGPGEPGHETWRPATAWKTGGGPIWVTGSYDPELNLTYWGAGNPGPDWNGDRRPGDNLYTDSVIALDPDTGKLKWHYQFTPHDEFDYDATQVPVLADMPVAGQPAQGDAVGEPQRLLVRARSHQRPVPAGQAVHESELGRRLRRERAAQQGARIRRPKARSSTRTTRARPTGTRRRSARAPASSTSRAGWTPSRRTSRRRSNTRKASQYVGRFPTMAFPALRPGRRRSTSGCREDGYGAIQAFDPKTGERKWEFKMVDVTDSGVLTTASDLLLRRRPRRLLLRARRAHRRAAVEGQRRRPGVGRTDVATRSTAGNTWRSPPAARCSCTRCGNRPQADGPAGPLLRLPQRGGAGGGAAHGLSVRARGASPRA